MMLPMPPILFQGLVTGILPISFRALWRDEASRWLR